MVIGKVLRVASVCPWNALSLSISVSFFIPLSLSFFLSFSFSLSACSFQSVWCGVLLLSHNIALFFIHLHNALQSLFSHIYCFWDLFLVRLPFYISCRLQSQASWRVFESYSSSSHGLLETPCRGEALENENVPHSSHLPFSATVILPLENILFLLVAYKEIYDI